MTEPTSTAPKKPKTIKMPLTASQWREVEALWKAGEATLAVLSIRFGVSVSTLARHLKGMKKGSRASTISSAVAEAVEKTIVDDSVILAARIRETKEDHYKMATGISKLAWAEILNARAAGTPFSTAANNLKALDNAMTILKKAREERFAVLGLDRTDASDPNDIPELVIAELTAQQIEDMGKADSLLDGEDGLVTGELPGEELEDDDGEDDDGDEVIVES